MRFLIEENTLQRYRPRLKKCGNLCVILSVAMCFVTMMTLLAIFAVDTTQRVYVVYLKGFEPKFITDEKFLSIALDSSLIASGFKHFDLKNPKIRKMMKALSPAYLRIGGTMADRLTFSNSKSLHFKHSNVNLDGGKCSYEYHFCDYLDRPNFTMNAQEWLDLNELAKSTNLEIIFDLNALKRFENGSWNYINAEKLINFSNVNNLNVHWELGNEPNAFRHQFNYEVLPSQLAEDFITLRMILKKYPQYINSKLIGPDVTRPLSQNISMDSQMYLKKFLREAGRVIDAVTWHQYYFNGATAHIGDFLDPHNFDILQWQCNTVKNIVINEGLEKPIWLGETSSAYGGGAPHLSNRYIASFLWLDKLGLAAKNGIDVVIRQSIFQGYYALINNRYSPTPDWWVSVLYKKLVAPKVVSCHFSNTEKVRLYCHCTIPESYYNNIPSVTVFGLNLNKHRVKLRFEGITPVQTVEIPRSYKVHAYVLSTVDKIDSRFIFLNEKLLQLNETGDLPDFKPATVIANPYVEMPAFSLGFWVVPIYKNALPFC